MRCPSHWQYYENGSGQEPRRREEKHLPSRAISAQLDEETDHEGGEQNKTGSTTNLCDEFGQVIWFLLQWSRVGISPESCETSKMISVRKSGDDFQRTHPS